MKRMQLFEFEDQSWFPSQLRDAGTDFLQFVATVTKAWKPALPLLARQLKACNTTRILDLGSGGGGGLLWINNELRKEIPDLHITISDYFPNQAAFLRTMQQADNISCIPESLNAMAVPEFQKGLRTMFLSLHHFRPEEAVSILKNAVDCRQGIAIFEGQERSMPSVIGMLISPLSVILCTPLIKPFRWSRLLFTYLIPLIPLFVLWDGLVSVLRTYSVAEMQDLCKKADPEGLFEWECARIRQGPLLLLYLLGRPRTQN